MDFEFGSELPFFERWALETTFGYNFVFLHRGDTIGFQVNLSTLRFFQISVGVLYRI
jgi:hypothetical protein